MEPGDTVTLNEEGKRRFSRMRERGPWLVLAVDPYDIVTIRRYSLKTGRPYQDKIGMKFLNLVRRGRREPTA